MSETPQSQASRQRAEQPLIESVHDAWAGLLEFAPQTRLSDLNIESIEPPVLWSMDSRELLSILRTIAVHSESARLRAQGTNPSGVRIETTTVIWRRFDA